MVDASMMNTRSIRLGAVQRELSGGMHPKSRPARRAILIAGMHRSGTSALAGTLVRLGATPPLTLMKADSSNAEGYYESKKLMQFHEELFVSNDLEWQNWMPFDCRWFDTAQAQDYRKRAAFVLEEEFGQAAVLLIKDPRICRFIPFWTDLLVAMEIVPSVVMPFRAPLDVARSLQSRDLMDLEQGLLLWLRHVLDAEFHSRGFQRCLIEMNDLLDDWRKTTGRLTHALDIEWLDDEQLTDANIDGFLNTKLRHHNAGEVQLADLHRWLSDTHRHLRELSRKPDSQSARDELDRIRLAFDEACSILAPAVKIPSYRGIAWKFAWRWRRLRRLVEHRALLSTIGFCSIYDCYVGSLYDCVSLST